MDPNQIKHLIEAGIEESEARVDGDGRHFQALVISAAFEGRSVIAQHRLVYAALGSHFDGDALHALSLRTYTPEQWRLLGTA